MKEVIKYLNDAKHRYIIYENEDKTTSIEGLKIYKSLEEAQSEMTQNCLVMSEYDYIFLLTKN